MSHIPGIFCFELSALCATVDIETDVIDADGLDTAAKVDLAVEVTVATVDRVAAGAAGAAGGVGLDVSMDAETIDNLARVRSKG